MIRNLQLDNYRPLLLITLATVAGGLIGSADRAILWLLVGSLLLIGSGRLLLQYPWLSIGLLLLLAPTSAYVARTGLPIVGGGLPLPLGQLLFAPLFLFFLLLFLAKKRSSLPQIKLLPFILPWILFTLFSTLWAQDASSALKEGVKWVEILILVGIGTLWFQNDDRQPPKKLVILLLLAGAAQGGIGLAQFLAADGPDSFQILGRFFRATGTFEQPNPYGGFVGWHTLLALGITLQIGVSTLFADRAERQTLLLNWGIPFLLFVLFAGLISGLGLIASWSRGAWLGAAAGFGGILFLLPQRRMWGGVALILAIAGGGLALQLGLIPQTITDRIETAREIEIRQLEQIEVTNENYAVLERFAFWAAAISMARQNLWLGVGMGNFDAAYADHFVGIWDRSLGHAHNYYINLLAETGIWGLLLYVLFWCALFFYNLKALTHHHASPLQRGIIIGLFGVWVAITVHHLVDNLYVNHAYFTLALMVALQEILLPSIDDNGDEDNGVEDIE